MEFQELRSYLQVTHNAIYMNTGWAGPTPTPVLLKIHETLKREAREGPASARGVAFTRQVMDETRQVLAGLLGSDVEEICLTHSTREGVHIVLYGIDWKAGDELVICDLEHPALTVPADVLTQRRGVKVKRAIIPPVAPKEDILADVKAQLTPQTRLLALSHIEYTCGLRMPIKELAQIAHEAGVPLFVDGAQSAGHIAVNVSDLGCDFYTVSGQKWLMGPVGTGALYVRKTQLHLLEPLFSTNTIEAARAMSRSPMERFSLVSQSPGLMAGLAESVRIIEELGMERIERRIMALSDSFRRAVGSIKGCSILSPQSQDTACGLVTVALTRWLPEELVSILQERFRIVARTVHHPDGVRFSIGCFNTEEETGKVAEALAVLLKERP